MNLSRDNYCPLECDVLVVAADTLHVLPTPEGRLKELARVVCVCGVWMLSAVVHAVRNGRCRSADIMTDVDGGSLTVIN